MDSRATDNSASDVAATYSVVIPVYGNRDTLADLVRRLEEVAGQLDAPLEAVFVVDGSPDDSHDLLLELLPSASFPSQVLRHSRNFGAFPAIRSGLAAARGRYIGVVAADLQEPPELLVDFFAALAPGGVDVAVGRRVARDDPALSSVFSRMYWSAYRRWVLPELPPGGIDVFAVTAQVRDCLVGLEESRTSLIGQLYWLGFRRQEVPYSRLERAVGASGWTFRKKVRYMLDSIFAFTSLPITALTLLGGVGAATTAIVSIIVLVARLTGGIRSAGYTPLMLVILFATFLLLFAIGVVGSYVFRIYENSKHRPVAVVASTRYFRGPDA